MKQVGSSSSTIENNDIRANEDLGRVSYFVKLNVSVLIQSAQMLFPRERQVIDPSHLLETTGKKEKMQDSLPAGNCAPRDGKRSSRSCRGLFDLRSI